MQQMQLTGRNAMSGKDPCTVNRRALLALGAGGVSALALSGTKLSVTTAFAQTRSPALPNYVPASVAPPDIPGSANGAEPGWINFPRNLAEVVADTPARGGEVNAMSLWVNAIP